MSQAPKRKQRHRFSVCFALCASFFSSAKAVTWLFELSLKLAALRSFQAEARGSELVIAQGQFASLTLAIVFTFYILHYCLLRSPISFRETKARRGITSSSYVYLTIWIGYWPMAGGDAWMYIKIELKSGREARKKKNRVFYPLLSPPDIGGQPLQPYN